MSLDDFELISKIGEGSYSRVYKARRLSDNQTYALKCVKIQSLNEKEKKNALSEIRILASINHSNVISYKESFLNHSDNTLCLIMEYADSGDLWQKIQKCIKKSSRLSEKTIWSIFIQMTRGLKALHDLSILHRDLKSANIFLSQDGNVKIGDMNVSKIAKDGFLRTQTGTPYYASPEVWKDMKYNYKSDIWSLGCVLYEVIALKPPFRGKNMEDLYEKVVIGIYDPIPKGYSKDLSYLVKLLLNTNPLLRPSCSEILSMEVVKRHSLSLRESSSLSCLMNTIRFPKELKLLTSALPKSRYENIEPESEEFRQSEIMKLKSEEVLNLKPKLEENEKKKNISTSKKKHNSLLIEDKAYLNDSMVLPKVKQGAIRKIKKQDINKIIEQTTERLKRIREIYLSPTSIALTPQSKKSVRGSVVRRYIFE